MSENLPVATTWSFRIAGTDPARLYDAMTDVLRGIVRLAGLNEVGAIERQLTPHGTCAAILLNEGHIAVRTWPESTVAYLTLTCSRSDLPVADCEALIERELGATSIIVGVIADDTTATYRAALTRGEQLVGTYGSTSTVTGAALYSIVEDGSAYYWEEWQLDGGDSIDAWVALDHYSSEVTLYTASTGEELDPDRVFIDAATGRASLPSQWSTEENSVGTVVAAEGSLTTQVSVGARFSYAQFRSGTDRVVVQRSAGTAKVRRGRILNPDEQIHQFGRHLDPHGATVAELVPSGKGWVARAAILLAAVGAIVGGVVLLGYL